MWVDGAGQDARASGENKGEPWAGGPLQRASDYPPARARTTPWPGAAPLWKKGQSGNPGGKNLAGSPRRAMARRLAAHPDADGIGKEAGEMGDAILDVAQALARTARQAEKGALDGRSVDALKGALGGLVALLDSLEPNVRKLEQVGDATPRVNITLAPPAAPPPRTITSESGQGPTPADRSISIGPPVENPALGDGS